MFEKSLQDVVKGIRANKRDPSTYISQVIQECKKELQEMDPFVKALAIRKLTYLQMMGYDMSWAAFQVVEVMSQPRFAHKRIGYLAACQSFSPETEVLLLTTNQLKKEFSAAQQYEVGQAINCLSNIVNTDLARDLLPDVVLLLNHSKPYVRKKAVLCMYKLFVKYPQGLRLTFDRLKERLADGEAAVVSCAVNVICELANKNPKNHLAMAPQFFRLLTTSSNNWMLIKVVKLLGSLVPEEPRLARKLLEPLATIIQNTAAKSLQYECISTVTLALPFTKRADGSDSKNVPAVVKLCAENLRHFVEDPDQNLKYLGLVGFVQLMRSHPKSVVDHKELVLGCLNDDDVTIRMRALELLTGMVTRRNLEELVHKLLRFVMLAEGAYRDELIHKIIFMCSRDKYAFLSDFAWYLSVLVDLATIQGNSHGKLVADQLLDVVVRVEPVRVFAMESMLSLLLNVRLMLGEGQATISEVLYAAAWIVGEHARFIKIVADRGAALEAEEDGQRKAVVPQHQPYLTVLDALTHPRATNLPAHVQVVYIQNAMKVLAAAIRVCDDAELEAAFDLMRERLHVFLQSTLVEVQERAATLKQLLVLLGIVAPTAIVGGAPADDPQAEADAVSSAVPELTAPAPTAASSISLLGDLDFGAPASSAAEVDLLGGGGGPNVTPPPATATPPPLPTAVTSSASSPASVSAARAALPLFEALVADPMQPVHPKAQRRVPAPAALDLGLPLNETALAEVLTQDDNIKPTTSINAVSFTEFQMYQEDQGISIEGIGSDHPPFGGGMTGFGSSGAGGGSGGSAGDGHGEYAGMDEGGDDAGRPQIFSTYDQSDPFYIRAVNPDEVEVDDIPMLKLRPEDLDGPRGKRKRGKKSKTKAKGVEYRINNDELMPVGLGLDTEESPAQGGRKGKNASDLSSIDLTTPLRADEVMPEQKHRVVAPTDQGQGSADAPDLAALSMTAEGSAASDKAHKSKSKKGKGGKKSKSKKDKSAPAGGGAGGGAGDELLDLMDFGSAAVASTAPAPVPAPSQPVDGLDLLGDGGSGGGDLLSGGGSGGRKAKKSKRQQSNGVDAAGGGSGKAGLGRFDYWVQVLDQQGLSVELKTSVSASKKQLKLAFRVRNASAESMTDVVVAMSAAPAGFKIKTGSVQVTPSIAAGGTSEGTLVLSGPASLDHPVSIQAHLSAKRQGLMSEQVAVPLALELPSAAMLHAAPVTPDDLVELLGERATHGASVKLPVQGRAEDPVVTIAGFLHARVVERPTHKTASLYAQFPSGDDVAVLVKVKESSVSVDVKSTQVQFAQQLCQDLRQLPL